MATLNGAIWAGNGGRTQTGYVVAGIEYAIPTTSVLNPSNAGAATLRAEYLHYDLGTLSVALPAAAFGPPGSSFTDRIRTTGDLVRGGINYKFDFSARPRCLRAIDEITKGAPMPKDAWAAPEVRK